MLSSSCLSENEYNFFPDLFRVLRRYSLSLVQTVTNWISSPNKSVPNICPGEIAADTPWHFLLLPVHLRSEFIWPFPGLPVEWSSRNLVLHPRKGKARRKVIQYYCLTVSDSILFLAEIVRHKKQIWVAWVGLRRKRCPVNLDCDGMVSISAIPYARNLPLLLCHERFNEASLPELPGY